MKPARIRLPRLIALSVFAVAAITLAFWTGPLVFYFEFQRPLEAHGLDTVVGSILRVELEPPAGSAPGAPARPREREGGESIQVIHRDVLLTLPAGDLVGLMEEKDSLVAVYGEGKVLVDRFPPGLIRSMFFGEVRRLGIGAQELPEAVKGLDDGALLHRISAATPADYRFGMRETERGIYAAGILSKLLIWSLGKVERAFLLDDGERKGVVMRGEGGEAKAVVSSPQGVFVFTIEGRFAPGWRADTDDWLEVLPVNDGLRRKWRERVEARFPDSHPLRRWARPAAAAAAD